MNKNRLIIAAAGAGKTTFLVKEALAQTGEVLITTYTEANEAEIKKKIIQLNRFIPANITVQTWFSFLLQHGVKPYQGCLTEASIKGLCLVSTQSAVRYKDKKGFNVCFKEKEFFEQHYFNSERKLYSDKLSKSIIRCNEKTNCKVIYPISMTYHNIFIDEAQDLAAYDLHVLKLFFGSKSNVIMVGDP